MISGNAKKILFFGMSYFVRELIETVSAAYPCIAVDSNVNFQEDLQGRENVAFLQGDANSIVLWKKLPLNEVSHIVFSLNDPDVACELCRIAREIFRLDMPITAIIHKNALSDLLTSYKVITVDPVNVGIQSLMALIEKNYATPSNIGLGKGEIAEVTIVRRSHLIDKKLRYMESSKWWKVVAIYRGGEFIMPDGDSELHLGDKVVLVGYPNMLDNIVNILMQGVPQFPLQYGNFINSVIHGYVPGPTEEANYFRSKTQALGLVCFADEKNTELAKKDDIIASMDAQYVRLTKNYKDPAVFNNAGTIVISAPQRFSMLNFRIKYFIRRSHVPLLLAKGVFPYSCIIAFLNSDNPGQIMQISLEISRISGLPLKAAYVTAPKSMRNARMESELENCRHMVREYESIERATLEFSTREGNPVKEFLTYQRNFPEALVVIGNNRRQRISRMEPHLPFLLSERIKCSVLIVPVAEN
ncbi:MAG: NAD-binding protein [Deferribacteraceae bacterium]|jgi:Trk K+ transport system NAD-binding subunit|nr:NAD-binding protein [Deferribacteraceae bacterium]